jgi:hypothetical protein
MSMDSSDSRGSSVEYRLPTFFLASSALLLYHAVSSTARDGLVLVVLLWLTASLQARTVSIYGHGIFFVTLLSLVWQQYQTSPSHILCSRPATQRSVALLSPFLSSVRLGAWTGLFLDTFITKIGGIPERTLLGVAALITLIHALYQWSRGRRQSWQQGLTGLPLVTNHGDLLTHPPSRTDESRRWVPDAVEWYHWGVAESLQWMGRLPKQGEQLVRLLGPEMLTCRQLRGLSVTDLRQMTQLPLGSVVDLLEQVQALEDRSPCPRDLLPHYSLAQGAATTNAHERTDDKGPKSWLERYDEEYSLSSRNLSIPNTTSNGDNELPVEATDRAQSIMKERFGLELPEIRHNATTTSGTESRSTDPGSMVAPSHMAATESRAPKAAMGMNSLPPEFLANMPPHISAIARSNPELVRKILASKRPAVTDKAPVESHAGLFTVPEPSSGREDDYSEEEWDDEDDGDDETYATSEEGERTELLRQRRRRPPPAAYHSIQD